MALVASAAIALAAPISRTARGAEALSAQERGDGILGALNRQLTYLSQVLVTPAVLGSDPRVSWGMGIGRRLAPQPLLASAVGSALDAVVLGDDRVGSGSSVAFTLHEDGFASSQVAWGSTVGDALRALGVSLAEHDAVAPSLDTPLTAGAHVYVDHAAAVEVTFAGEVRTVYSRAQTVGGLLSEAGYKVEATDLVFPSLSDPIRDSMKVIVTTLRETVEFEDQPIAFETRYEYDADLAQGRSMLVQEGVEGHFRRQYKVRRVDGVEISRELVSEVVVLPVDEVILVGTYVAPAPTAEPPQPPLVVPGPTEELVCSRTMTVYATWYTAASAGGNGITATGVKVDKGIVAVDPAVIPLGTRMYIPGYGYGVAADTGGGIVGNMIDLGFGEDDVPDWRTQWVDICILD